VLGQGKTQQLAKNYKTNTPKPSEGQVHPTARSLTLRIPSFNTNRSALHSEVLLSSILGTSIGHFLPGVRFVPEIKTPGPHFAKPSLPTQF
jgi:hypothetical protein